MSRPDDIAAGLRSVRERVAEAERAAGRPPGSVRLVAVTKKMPLEDLRAAFAAGQRDFGENYAQELVDKQAAWAETSAPAAPADEPPLRWHFIGPLQTNKVKLVAGHVELLHSIDSVELVHRLTARLTTGDPAVQACLVQVNLGGEAQKRGVPAEALPTVLDAFTTTTHAVCRGLMLIPPASATDDELRRQFAALRELARREAAVPRPQVDLRELSMGMSHDFPLAIAEGASMVRVGTAIFGARPR